MGTFNINVGGDIFADLTTDVDSYTIIAHGVNVKGVMGGFAALIDKKFPVDADEYRRACESGMLTVGNTHLTGVEDAPEGPNLLIAHVASQENPGPDAKVMWLVSALEDLAHQVDEYLSGSDEIRNQVTIRLPLIGGGIGGIDPLVSAAIIRMFAEHLRKGCGASTVLYLLESDPHTEAVVAAVGG